MRKIPNDVFRDAFKNLEEREGLTLAEVAQRCGWETKDKRTGKMKADSSRVARSLGLVAESGRYREAITYENAVRLCDALHIDYLEVGV